MWIGPWARPRVHGLDHHHQRKFYPEKDSRSTNMAKILLEYERQDIVLNRWNVTLIDKEDIFVSIESCILVRLGYQIRCIM